MSRLRWIPLLALMVCLSTGMAYSQAVSGTLLGSITDASGGTVNNAKVTITEETTGVSHTIQSNDSGNFTFPDLAPGHYAVTVEIAGFKKEVRKGIEVRENETSRANLQLSPGSITESIEVTGAAPALQTDRADVSLSLIHIYLPIGGK